MNQVVWLEIYLPKRSSHIQMSLDIISKCIAYQRWLFNTLLIKFFFLYFNIICDVFDRGSRQWVQLMLMSHPLDTNSSSAWLLRELTAATSPFGTMEVEKKRFNVKLRKSRVLFRILSGLLLRPSHLVRFYLIYLIMLWFHPKSQEQIHRNPFIFLHI